MKSKKLDPAYFQWCLESYKGMSEQQKQFIRFKMLISNGYPTAAEMVKSYIGQPKVENWKNKHCNMYNPKGITVIGPTAETGYTLTILADEFVVDQAEIIH